MSIKGKPPLLYAFLLTVLVFTLPAIAGSSDFTFSPEALSKSTVKILIKTNNEVVASATGFVWRKQNQIVTSLHLMSDAPNTRVIVEFERKKRLATIKKLLPSADLVLLEVTNPVADWIPLTDYNHKKPKYRAEAAALGFNRGSNGMSTRELRKGYITPEILKELLPPDAVAKLNKSNLVDLRLPIYYFDGSLLPGYSGAPVVDNAGKLIGIGNGGLENGASSVSWVIPAYQLANLIDSSISTLPAAFGSVNSTFSGDNTQHRQPSTAYNDKARHHKPAYDRTDTTTWQLTTFTSALLPFIFSKTLNLIDQTINPLLPFTNVSLVSPVEPPHLPAIGWSLLPGTTFTQLHNQFAAFIGSNSPAQPDNKAMIAIPTVETTNEAYWESNYREVSYDQFLFIKTKSRDYQQMLASSSDPDGLKKVFQIYKAFFKGYQIDHRNFVFDIYEDGRTGLNIAVPHGVELTVDDGRYLLVDGEMFCQTCPYEIQYHVRTRSDHDLATMQSTPEKFLEKVAYDHLADLLAEGPGYGEYQEFRHIESYGSDRHVLRALYSNFQNSHQQEALELNYFTAATSRDTWFQAQGILNRFDQEFIAALNKHQGTNCGNINLEQSKTALCGDLETILKILMSVHLTSFSNKFISEN